MCHVHVAQWSVSLRWCDESILSCQVHVRALNILCFKSLIFFTRCCVEVLIHTTICLCHLSVVSQLSSPLSGAVIGVSQSEEKQALILYCDWVAVF